MNHLKNHIYHKEFHAPSDKNRLPFSEHEHLQNLDHWSTKISREIFRQTKEEKQALKKAMLNYPNRNRKPLSV